MLPTLHLSRSLSSEDLVKTLKSILKGYREELQTKKLTLTSQKEVEYSSGLRLVLRRTKLHGQEHITTHTTNVIADNDMSSNVDKADTLAFAEHI